MISQSQLLAEKARLDAAFAALTPEEIAGMMVEVRRINQACRKHTVRHVRRFAQITQAVIAEEAQQ